MKIKSAQLGPDQLARFLKGVVVVADPKRGIIVRSRPKKKKQWSKLQQQYRKRFGFAAIMASNPERMQLETAHEMAKGTEQVPRDILTMAALGQYYIFQMPDGSVNGHVPGPIYEQPKPEETEVAFWSIYDAAWNTAYSSSSYAFKGSNITPYVNMTIKGAKAIVNAVSGGTYQFAIGTYDGSNQIDSLTLSTISTAPVSAQIVLEFDIDFTFVSGTQYFIMVGRTDAGDTYKLPVYYAIKPQFLFPQTSSAGVRLDKASPAIGQTVNFAANDCPPFGLVPA